jgi:hypothetical protein
VTDAAVAAAVQVARDAGLDVREPVVLSQRSNLLVQLAPAPVVARIPHDTARVRERPQEWLAREVAVAGHAAGRGAPVLAPSPLLAPGPVERDGAWMTFWTLAAPAAPEACVPDAAGLGASLAALHAGLRDHPALDELPFLLGPLDEVRSVAARLAADGIAGDRWAERADALEPVLRAAGGPLQALHGDAHPGNVMFDGPRLVWFDLEDTCRGPVAWDLAVLVGRVGEAALDGYPDAPSRDELAPFLEARQLQAEVWTEVFARYR